MQAVVDAVNQALPWYSSVHRGAGQASQVSTRLYEASRRAVHRFVGARPTDVVVLVRNTTDALNQLAATLPISKGQVVLTTAVEHHANLLPWRRRAPVVHIPPLPSPALLLDAVREALRAHDVAIVAACTELQRCGMDAVADHERDLLRHLDERMARLDRVRVHRLWHGDGVDRLGVCTFTVEGVHHALTAAYLSAEHAIGVRHGCFCAHP